MNSERIGVRLSPALRALIGQAGEEAAAVRSLLILGAHAAGYDVSGLSREILALSFAHLDPLAAAAIRKMLNTMLNSPLNNVLNIAEVPPLPAPTMEEAPDPFAVGIEV